MRLVRVRKFMVVVDLRKVVFEEVRVVNKKSMRRSPCSPFRLPVPVHVRHRAVPGKVSGEPVNVPGVPEPLDVHRGGLRGPCGAHATGRWARQRPDTPTWAPVRP